MFPRPCAEFPNDNPALYESVVARSAELCTTVTDEPLEIEPLQEEPIEEALLSPQQVDVPDRETSPSPEESIAAMNPFVSLVAVLVSVARDAGASESLAACVRGLLGLERLTITPLPEASLDALRAGMQLEGTPQTPRRPLAFTQTVLAWQAILNGEGEDFAACGSATLDEWTADLLSRLLGDPSLAASIRRELRRRGVAAFGLVAEAA